MKTKTIALFLVTAFLSIQSFAQTPKSKPASAKMTTSKNAVDKVVDTFEYFLGMYEARTFKKAEINFNFESYKKGFFDANVKYQDRTDAEIQELVSKGYEKYRIEKVNKEAKKSKEFIMEISKKPNVKPLIEGNVYYEVLTPVVSGKSPSDTSKVKVLYTGTLPNGNVFDDNIKTSEPATFPLNGVIRGFSEALKKMKVGETWRVYISPEYGYGNNGAGQAIPGGSALIFVIQLVDVL